MTRTTEKQIHEIENYINETMEEHGYTWHVFVQWAYGQPRAYRQENGRTGVSDLSPRLPMGQMKDWLHAFAAGMRVGLNSEELKQVSKENLIARAKLGAITHAYNELLAETQGTD